MKYVIGVLFIVAGFLLAIYLGIFVFLIGGIKAIVDGAKANPTDAGLIAWGVIQVCVLAELSAYIIVGVFWYIGDSTMSSSSPRTRGPSNRQVETDWQRRMRDGM